MTVEQLTVPVEENNPFEAVLLAHPSLDAYGSEFLTRAGQLSIEHPEVADAYFTLYERLAMQAGNTAWMFPESERDSVRQATIDLFGGTIDTVLRHHAAGNETHTALELKGRQPAKVDLYGTEPLAILDSLSQVYWVAGEVMSSDPRTTVRSVLSEHKPDYSIYRFIDTAPEPYVPPCTTLYIRSRAGESFNPTREYGNGRGVEASVQLRVDLKLLREYMNGRDARMIGIANSAEANDGVICLRVDRSGVEIEMADGTMRRLPTTFDGSANHDIGSIVRDGARGIGRFLSMNRSDLNHLPIADRYGSADAFADYANELEERVQERRIFLPKLRPALRKQRVGRAVIGGFPAFVPGQNPYDIPGVRELAAYSGITLGKEPNDAEMQQLFDAWGSQKAFRYNIPKMRGSTPHVDYDHIARQVSRSNILGDMPLRTISDPNANLSEPAYALVREAVGPWFEKRARYLQWLHEHGVRIGGVVLAATERPLNTPTEVVQPEVVALQRQLRRQPTAVDLMQGPIRERLEGAGLPIIDTVALPYKRVGADGVARIVSGNELTRAVAEAHPELANAPVIDALNAPAGGMFIGSLETLVDALPDFRAEQFYMGHNRSYIARSYLDNITTRFFQNVYSAPSSLVRWMSAVYKVNKRLPKL